MDMNCILRARAPHNSPTLSTLFVMACSWQDWSYFLPHSWVALFWNSGSLAKQPGAMLVSVGKKSGASRTDLDAGGNYSTLTCYTTEVSIGHLSSQVITIERHTSGSSRAACKNNLGSCEKVVVGRKILYNRVHDVLALEVVAPCAGAGRVGTRPEITTTVVNIHHPVVTIRVLIC